MDIAICDDCIDIIGSIQEIISDCFQSLNDFNCEAFLSAEELLEAIEGEEQKYQIFLLDIELKELNGLELAHRIRLKNQNAIIIFITSHKELMQSAFEVNAFHYLTKPIDPQKAKQVLLKAINSLCMNKMVFQYKVRKAVNSVFYDQIILFESYKRKITIYTQEKDLVFYGSLNNIIKEINPLLFVQVHKSYIVNMNYIKYMDQESIVMCNGQKILITKKYHKTFNESYNNYILMRL